MSENTLNRTMDVSASYRMDHVLFEIYEQEALDKDGPFDPWKVSVLHKLQSEGFVELKNDSYVLTDMGKQVIASDSIADYYKRLKFQNKQDKKFNSKAISYLITFIYIVVGVVILAISVYTFYKVTGL